MANGKDAVEFYNYVSRLYGSRPKTIKQLWRAVVEVIVRELYTSGNVYLPDIGYFILKEKPAYIAKETRKDGTVHYFEMPERDVPVFYPEDEFINDVNMIGLTKSYRARKREGKLTLRDKEREIRAKQIMGLEYEEVDSAEERKKQFYAEEFNKKMEALKKEWEEQKKETEEE